jgi:aspartate-semialdehyde dehydrogenase
MSGPVVAVVGATGAVGEEFFALFRERSFPIGELRLLASARSAGKTLTVCGGSHTVRELGKDSFKGVDIALFSAGGARSLAYAPHAVDAGALVIDNSSAYRMDEDVPLVIPEINGHLVDDYCAGDGKVCAGIIANPNCSTIIMLVPLEPLRKRFGIERIVTSTYQAASGAGAAAMRELESLSRTFLDGGEMTPEIFAEPCAFNVFSHDSAMDASTGRNQEEQKMINETHKIWDDETVGVSATCIRVGVMRAHAESINVTLSSPASEAEVRGALAAGAGLEVCDDRSNNSFPTPHKASGRDAVLVGRIRPDETQGNADGRYVGWELFVCGDQLRKGAALNALQIAERALGVG